MSSNFGIHRPLTPAYDAPESSSQGARQQRPATVPQRDAGAKKNVRFQIDGAAVAPGDDVSESGPESLLDPPGRHLSEDHEESQADDDGSLLSEAPSLDSLLDQFGEVPERHSASAPDPFQNQRYAIALHQALSEDPNSTLPAPVGGGQDHPQGPVATPDNRTGIAGPGTQPPGPVNYQPFRPPAVLRKKNRPQVEAEGTRRTGIEHRPDEQAAKREHYEATLKDGKTGFTVPSKNAPDRWSQPRGTNAHRAQPMNNELFRGPFRQTEKVADGALLTGGTDATPADVGLQEGGFSALTAQRAGAALYAAFNFVTANSKQTRYTDQLNLMLQDDVRKFKWSEPNDITRETVTLTKAKDGKSYEYDMSKVAKLAGSNKPYLHAEAGRAKEILHLNDDANRGKLMLQDDIKRLKQEPELEDLMFKKDKDGNYQYDMDKVAKLAESDDPEQLEEAGHARDILFSDSQQKKLDGMKGDDFKNLMQNRLPDTIILSRSKDGKYQYDMDKVAKLAESDQPELAEASMHAKNILLMDHIANDVSRKNKNRAVYEFVRNSLGTAGGIAAIVGTHGAAAGGAAAAHFAIAKTSGYAFAATGAINPARDIRFAKQQMRMDKASLIRTRETQKRDDFAEENKDGFKAARKPGEIGPAFTPMPVDEMPQEAIKGVHGAFRDQATREVNKNNAFLGFIPAKWVNEKKQYSAKKDRRDFVGEHATRVILENVGVDKEENLPRFRQTIKDFNAAKGSKQDAVMEAAINSDPGLKTAYRLVRDMGGGKKESLQIIRNTMELAIRKKQSGDEATALLSGAGDENLEKEVGKRMGADMSRRR